MSGVRPFEIVQTAVVAIFFLAAPTAGDIGGCSQTAGDLDATKFFAKKQDVDCQRCNACHLTTATCKAACGAPQGGAFPDMCDPLEHDGEVCIGALEAASCADYQSFVADQGATVPTECNFCPPRSGAP